MTKRKHISWKTKCAAALLHLVRDVAYDDAKKMTEDQFLSLFHFDHNILHSSEHADRDRFWNLTPMFIAAHRQKTKTDAKIIAKGRRIRGKEHALFIHREMRDFVRKSPELALAKAFKIRSRGFDKTMRKRMDGKVEKR